MGKIADTDYHGISVCFSPGDLGDRETVAKEVLEAHGQFLSLPVQGLTGNGFLTREGSCNRVGEAVSPNDDPPDGLSKGITRFPPPGCSGCSKCLETGAFA